MWRMTSSDRPRSPDLQQAGFALENRVCSRVHIYSATRIQRPKNKCACRPRVLQHDLRAKAASACERHWPNDGTPLPEAMRSVAHICTCTLAQSLCSCSSLVPE